MALELYQRAVLTADLPTEGLRAGDIGTVVDKHQVPGVSEIGYSVEFFDLTGRTVAVVTIPDSSLREPTTQDIPTVRALTGSR